MYIDTIRLENIRGFRELEFSFDRGQGQYAGWTVLTGDNGSGKSTVLEAIACWRAPRLRRALQPICEMGPQELGARIRLSITRCNDDDGYGPVFMTECIVLTSMTQVNNGKSITLGMT
ncbi:MAG: AAA family ATPase [Sphaerotilus natans]